MTIKEFKKKYTHNVVNFEEFNNISNKRKRKLRELKRTTDQLNSFLESVL